MYTYQRGNPPNKSIKEITAMKKVIINIVLSCLCLVIAGTCAINFLGTYEMQGCEVIAVVGDKVVVENRAGYVWSWYDTEAESYDIGDVVTLIMDTNNSEEDFGDDTVQEVIREEG